MATEREYREYEDLKSGAQEFCNSAREAKTPCASQLQALRIFRTITGEGRLEGEAIVASKGAVAAFQAGLSPPVLPGVPRGWDPADALYKNLLYCGFPVLTEDEWRKREEEKEPLVRTGIASREGMESEGLRTPAEVFEFVKAVQKELDCCLKTAPLKDGCSVSEIETRSYSCSGTGSGYLVNTFRVVSSFCTCGESAEVAPGEWCTHYGVTVPVRQGVEGKLALQHAKDALQRKLWDNGLLDWGKMRW